MGREKRAPATGDRKEVLRLRLERDLILALRARSEELATDVHTFAGWCIATGLHLGDLNSFVQARRREES